MPLNISDELFAKAVQNKAEDLDRANMCDAPQVASKGTGEATGGGDAAASSSSRGGAAPSTLQGADGSNVGLSASAQRRRRRNEAQRRSAAEGAPGQNASAKRPKNSGQ